MTQAEQRVVDAERALLARLEAEEHADLGRLEAELRAGWGTVTPVRSVAPKPVIHDILRLLAVLMRDDEAHHRDLLTHHPWNVWARTGQQKRAA